MSILCPHLHLANPRGQRSKRLNLSVQNGCHCCCYYLRPFVVHNATLLHGFSAVNSTGQKTASSLADAAILGFLFGILTDGCSGLLLLHVSIRFLMDVGVSLRNAGVFACQQLPTNHGKRKHIDGLAATFVANNFRRHPAARSRLSIPIAGGQVQIGSDAKVCDFDLKVSRCNVAMSFDRVVFLCIMLHLCKHRTCPRQYPRQHERKSLEKMSLSGKQKTDHLHCSVQAPNTKFVVENGEPVRAGEWCWDGAVFAMHQHWFSIHWVPFWQWKHPSLQHWGLSNWPSSLHPHSPVRCNQQMNCTAQKLISIPWKQVPWTAQPMTYRQLSKPHWRHRRVDLCCFCYRVFSLKCSFCFCQRYLSQPRRVSVWYLPATLPQSTCAKLRSKTCPSCQKPLAKFDWANS